MSDRSAVALAVCAAFGAWVGIGPPLLVAVAALAVALLLHRPWILCVTIVLLVGARSESDRLGLVARPREPFAGWVTLVNDPVAGPSGAVTVELRIGARHVEATARGAPARVVLDREAGDRLELHGTLGAVAPGSSWLTRRHIAAQLVVAEVGGWKEGIWPARLANVARDALERSAAALPERQRGLYLGLVLGDDRDEAPDIADDFRGAGLSHLLAVSGQNVAFVLALATPLFRRSSLRTRLVTTIAVLGLFVLATRAEPSVLRAAVMAGIAAVAATLGREASGIRVLSLAVTGLLVADPFLIESIGFQLSVAASAAILVLARPLAHHLPGPRPLAEAVSVSVAAQVGVAPILAVAFGGVPLAGLLANVLAAPAAGPVMAWGVIAGLVGGWLGPTAAAVVHLPTRLLVGWLALVARWSARLPFGALGLRELAVLALAVGTIAVGRRAHAHFIVIVGVALALAALVAPAIALSAPGPAEASLSRGAVLWRDGASVLVIDGRARADDVLAGLREAGVDRLDVLVVRSTSPTAVGVAEAVEGREEIGEVFEPRHVAAAVERRVGQLVVAVEPSGSGLAVEVRVGQ
ncbi:MAG: ComEC/Rec2 family competence protein [Acidimicrobiales bacterium]